MQVNDENSRIRIQDPDPDPLVKGMDPRIRIRIHPKMSWIRNTAFKAIYSLYLDMGGHLRALGLLQLQLGLQASRLTLVTQSL